MTGFGANEDDMGFFSKISERELDGVLAGKASRGELEDVATFFRELRNEFEEPVPTEIESQHLAAIFNEVHHLQPSMSEPQAPALRGARTLPNPFRWLAARAPIAAVGLAAFAAFGGAAYAGVLPGPVQAKVADIAHHVGVSLPDKRHHSKPLGGSEHRIQHTSTLDQPAGHGPVNGAQGSTPSSNQDGGDQGSSQSNDENGGAQGSTHSNDQNDGAQRSETTTGSAEPSNAGSQGTDSPGSGTHQDDLTPQGETQGAQTKADQGQQTTTVRMIVPAQPGTNDTQDGQSQPSADTGSGSDQQGSGSGN